MTSRRHFLAGSAATLACAVAPRVLAQHRAEGRVVVVGGGYGGATLARYLREWSGGSLDVTLVERDPAFVSCPMSNLVLGGSRTLADLTFDYVALAARGVRVVHATAQNVDPTSQKLILGDGRSLDYDRLVLSPGIDFMFEAIPAFADPGVRARFPHAWQAGPQTLTLRHMLEAMREGGVFAITVPIAPLRCPPAPYERACQVASYLKRANPRAKVLILDANDDVLSKKELFRTAWSALYPGIVEYRPSVALTDVDPATRTLKFDFGDDVTADVINVIPPQRAAAIAAAAGVVTANGRWCEVDFLTFEAVNVRNVHVLGDAIQTAPLMPKSAHMANQQAKVCAAAIVALQAGGTVDQAPMLANTCYSFMNDTLAAHVTSVHRYDTSQRTFLPVEGAGGVSAASNALEAAYGEAWAANIRADSFG
jgi:sulfide dehydrogenase [flavocytochrome c] flavoprotein chain